MKAIPFICLLALLAGCVDSSVGTDPSPNEHETYELTVRADCREAWSGDTVRFTVTPQVPIPPDNEYRWEISVRETYSTEVLRTRDTVLAVFLPHWQTSGSRDTGREYSVIVSVMTPTAENPDYLPGYAGTFVRLSTGELTVTPDTAYWDTDIPLSFTASYRGRIPAEGYVEWSFGDGATEAAAADVPHPHAFATAGTYASVARLKRHGSNDVIAVSAPAHVVIDRGKPGRFLRLTIVGLERTYTRGGSTYVTADTIDAYCRRYLRWDGELFRGNDRMEWLRDEDIVLDCGGLVAGTMLDTLRVDLRVSIPNETVNRVNIKLEQLPRVSEHQWSLAGEACAKAITQYADNDFYNPMYCNLRSWRFLDNARITLTIDHHLP